MGAAQPNGKSKFGYIVLQLDHPFVYSGTELTGTIHLQLDQPFPAT